MDDIFVYADNRILRGDPVVGPIKAITRVQTAAMLKDKSYVLTEKEQAIVGQCKRAKVRGLTNIILGVGGVTALGLVFSARKKEILQYSILIGGLLVYQQMTDEYGSCLFGMCQLRDSPFASQIRLKVFQRFPKSQSADFLRGLGYDEKHIDEPTVSRIPPLHEAKQIEIKTELVTKDPSLLSILNRMRAFFPSSVPSFMKFDDITAIYYEGQQQGTNGVSFHAQGSIPAMVTMLRRVDAEYEFSKKLKDMESWVVHTQLSLVGGECFAQLVAVAKGQNAEINVPKEKQGGAKQDGTSQNTAKQDGVQQDMNRQANTKQDMVRSSMVRQDLSLRDVSRHATTRRERTEEKDEEDRGHMLLQDDMREERVLEDEKVEERRLLQDDIREERLLQDDMREVRIQEDERRETHQLQDDIREERLLQDDMRAHEYFPDTSYDTAPRDESHNENDNQMPYSNSFNFNEYFGDNNSVNQTEQKVKYVSEAQRRHERLHAKGNSQSWDDIRRKN